MWQDSTRRPNRDEPILVSTRMTLQRWLYAFYTVTQLIEHLKDFCAPILPQDHPASTPSAAALADATPWA